MRILFIGTGDIGLPALRCLLHQPAHTVCGVICQPDKPVGRKLVLTPPATKVLALEHGVPVHQPARIRHAAELIASLQPDLAVVMAYGQILPQAVLDLPPLGCLNLHASLLPEHRGAAPIQASILAGDTETGITVMYMDAGLDTGDILLIERLPIHAHETGGSLHDRLAELAPVALEKALALLAAGAAPRTPQDHAAATHTGKLERQHGILDWSQPAEQLARRIHAFDPWPGTTTTLPGGERIKVFPPVETASLSPAAAPLGTLLAVSPAGLVIACGAGSLTLHELQPEGRKRMTVPAFLAGHPLAAGTELGS
jgi:methionyl-tRNA formyltransferase